MDVLYMGRDSIILYSCMLTFGGLIQNERVYVLSRKPLDPEFDHDEYLLLKGEAKMITEDKLDDFSFDDTMYPVV
jgi:hypothetical protein